MKLSLISFRILQLQQSMKEKPKNLNKQNKNEAKNNFKNNEKNQSLDQHVQVNLIDDIFKEAKHKKAIKKEQPKKEHQIQQEKERKLQIKLKKQWKIEQQLRKANEGQTLTGDKVAGGIKIYTEQQLNMGKGGSSKLCPFDCNCCF